MLGYILAFSYEKTQNENKNVEISTAEWVREKSLRDELTTLERNNLDLQKELYDKQETVMDIEKNLSNQANIYFNLAEDIEKYRMFLGKVKVKGPGIKVTLGDAEYNPSIDNVNDYIVHEHHVFKVVNELYISGASAVAINGQRLSHHSYIMCEGPVITVDGQPHPAPFEITAIGDSEVLFAALNLAGGVKDQLVSENVVFSLQKQGSLMMEPLL